MIRWFAASHAHLHWCKTILPAQTKTCRLQATRAAVNPATSQGQVVRCVGSHGGRIYQREIVRRLGWSASKTSRVLTAMEEAGIVDRYQIGRQKIVCFPEDEPERFPARSE